MNPLDWDAAVYHRVSDPQESWAGGLIERMRLKGDETVLDAGCGSGRVTALLAEALPAGRVVAVDASPAMLAAAASELADRIASGRVELRESDLLELELQQPLDAVFSCAVFHHIQEHDRLFRRLRSVLKQGGRLTAQCGGEGNLERFRALSEEVCSRAPFAEPLAGLGSPWNYAAPDETQARLLAAGFSSARAWRQAASVVPSDARAFVQGVLLNYHVDRLKQRAGVAEGQLLAEQLTSAVLAAAGSPLRLDYVRLNIEAVA